MVCNIHLIPIALEPEDGYAGSWRWPFLSELRALVDALEDDEVPLHPDFYEALEEAMDPQLRFCRTGFEGPNLFFRGHTVYPDKRGYFIP